MDIGQDSHSRATLYERHGSALCVVDASLAARPPAEGCEDRAHEDLKDVPDQDGVVGQTVAQRDGKRENPLAHRHVRKVIRLSS